MAYTFPLSITEFMSVLPVAEMTFDLPEAVEISETGGGEILSAALGTRLWQGQVTLGDMTADEAAEALAMIDVVRSAGGSFMIYDVSRPGPRADVTGALLGSASPILNAVNANSRDVRISGLPIGYQLQRYDSIAFSYGTNPVRFARHRVGKGSTADSTGLTGWIEVVPALRPGWARGTAVQLLKPACKAVIIPGSVQPGRRRHTITTGASFKWLQSLR